MVNDTFPDGNLKELLHRRQVGDASTPQVASAMIGRYQEGRRPMKEFHCGSLVPGCDWHTRHDEEAEVMRR
jgi:hypothetical protein